MQYLIGGVVFGVLLHLSLSQRFFGQGALRRDELGGRSLDLLLQRNGPRDSPISIRNRILRNRFRTSSHGLDRLGNTQLEQSRSLVRSGRRRIASPFEQKSRHDSTSTRGRVRNHDVRESILPESGFSNLQTSRARLQESNTRQRSSHINERGHSHDSSANSGFSNFDNSRINLRETNMIESNRERSRSSLRETNLVHSAREMAGANVRKSSTLHSDLGHSHFSNSRISNADPNNLQNSAQNPKSQTSVNSHKELLEEARLLRLLLQRETRLRETLQHRNNHSIQANPNSGLVNQNQMGNTVDSTSQNNIQASNQQGTGKVLLLRRKNSQNPLNLQIGNTQLELLGNGNQGGSQLVIQTVRNGDHSTANNIPQSNMAGHITGHSNINNISVSNAQTVVKSNVITTTPKPVPKITTPLTPREALRQVLGTNINPVLFEELVRDILPSELRRLDAIMSGGIQPPAGVIKVGGQTHSFHSGGTTKINITPGKNGPKASVSAVHLGLGGNLRYGAEEPPEPDEILLRKVLQKLSG